MKLCNLIVGCGIKKKVELWGLTFCIAVNGEKLQCHAVILTLVRQCPISKLSESYFHTMYLNFMLLDQFLFELSCENTHSHGTKL